MKTLFSILLLTIGFLFTGLATPDPLTPTDTCITVIDVADAVVKLHELYGPDVQIEVMDKEEGEPQLIYVYDTDGSVLYIIILCECRDSYGCLYDQPCLYTGPHADDCAGCCDRDTGNGNGPPCDPNSNW